MPRYLIERDIPGLGKLTQQEIAEVSRGSVKVLNTMAPRVQWVQSYVTDDKLFCVYLADDPEAVREHATCGGFPANLITRVHQVIDPTTAEG
jgi:hypothetical protein